MDAKPYTVYIYGGEAELISMWTLRYTNIETGGDIFGLWMNENELVIQAVLGPGQNCRRTPTSFFQDEEYLSKAGEVLTINQGLCNIGSWHSHHSMNLPEPSCGDRDTIWRHLPNPGRFLLLIAMIEWRNDGPRVSMAFNLFEATSQGEKVTRMKLEILEGESPIRANAAVSNQISQGAEVPSKKTSSRKRESQAGKTKEAGERVRARQEQTNLEHRHSRGGRHEPQGSGHENLKCDGLVALYFTHCKPHYHDYTAARNKRRQVPPRMVHGYRIRYVRISHDTEIVELYHFDHPVGQCGECLDVALERKNGSVYAVHRSNINDCDCCCTIL
ncbi:uncharacterized protein LOC114517800 [Dendronephthya gigantea]|uniref:uncharacterized protein LOC114517800 n=1 Tax=Dendronephthya gigantea TaxID=151771 RepID=UPI00106D7928|nr:uncharacterized protein LOC114517800 [Dendronephthya gigantea]